MSQTTLAPDKSEPYEKTFEGGQVGALDPDGAERINLAGGNASMAMKHMINHHIKSYPANLRLALSLERNEPLTKNLDLNEVSKAALTLGLPEGSTLDSAAVRGSDDGKKFVTITYISANGRPAKAFTVYTAKAFPNSVAAGKRAVIALKHAEKLAENPTGTLISMLEQLVAGKPAVALEGEPSLHDEDEETEVGATSDQIDELREEMQDAITAATEAFTEQVSQFKSDVMSAITELATGAPAPAAPAIDEELPAPPSEPTGDGNPEPPASTSTETAQWRDHEAEAEQAAKAAVESEEQAPEPFPGYDALNVEDAKKAVADADPKLLPAFLKFERSAGGKRRSTVIRAIESRLSPNA